MTATEKLEWRRRIRWARTFNPVEEERHVFTCISTYIDISAALQLPALEAVARPRYPGLVIIFAPLLKRQRMQARGGPFAGARPAPIIK